MLFGSDDYVQVQLCINGFSRQAQSASKNLDGIVYASDIFLKYVLRSTCKLSTQFYAMVI